VRLGDFAADVRLIRLAQVPEARRVQDVDGEWNTLGLCDTLVVEGGNGYAQSFGVGTSGP
jgi:hypothetical protein